MTNLPPMVERSRLIFSRVVACPLGRLTMAGLLRIERGQQHPAPRVFGSYAVALIVGGAGLYTDRSGRREVGVGDMILVFPDVEHAYGPTAGSPWREIYLVFDGPVFDLWRKLGLLDPARPLLHLGEERFWFDRLRDLAQLAAHSGAGQALDVVLRWQKLLADILETQNQAEEPGWLLRARHRLATTEGTSPDLAAIAREVGLSYESFRKKFAANTGLAPAQFYRTHRFQRACELLQGTDQTNQQIAAFLGYGDEFQFCKAFAHHHGLSPGAYRKQARRR